MEIAVHSRHVEVPTEVRQLAEKKVAHLDRYLPGLERGDVCFSDGRPGRLGHPCSCEVVLEGGGHVIRVHGSGARQTDALDEALSRATHRARRVKDKLVKRSRPRHRANVARTEAPPLPLCGDDETGVS